MSWRRLGEPFRGLGHPLGSPLGADVPWYQSGGAPLPIAVYVAKGAASLAASLVNLVTPGTHDLTSGVAPTLQAAGWLANAAAYLITDLVPALTWTVIERHSGQEDASRAFFGVITSGTQNFYNRHSGGTNANFFNGNQQLFVPGGYRAAGVFAMAGKTTFIDGVQQTNIAAGGTDPTHVLYLMGINNAGAVSTRLNQGHLQAVAIYNSTLTPAQTIAVMNAMALL